jgi:hypothetical protein
MLEPFGSELRGIATMSVASLSATERLTVSDSAAIKV